MRKPIDLHQLFLSNKFYANDLWTEEPWIDHLDVDESLFASLSLRGVWVIAGRLTHRSTLQGQERMQ